MSVEAWREAQAATDRATSLRRAAEQVYVDATAAGVDISQGWIAFLAAERDERDASWAEKQARFDHMDALRAARAHPGAEAARDAAAVPEEAHQ